MKDLLVRLRESGVRYLLVSRNVHLTSVVHCDGDDKICTSSWRLVVPSMRVLCRS